MSNSTGGCIQSASMTLQCSTHIRSGQMRIGHITRYDTHRQVTTFGVMKQPFITFVSVLMRLFAGARKRSGVGEKVNEFCPKIHFELLNDGAIITTITRGGNN